MIIVLTIAVTLTVCAFVAYIGARAYWARTQEPGRHRTSSSRRSLASEMVLAHAGRALTPFRR